MKITIAAQKFYTYSSFIQGYSDATIRRYKYVIDAYSAFSKVTDTKEITAKSIRALFLKGRTERKWSVNTYLVYYKSLHVFCEWCVKQGYLDRNPVSLIDVPKQEKRLPSILNKQTAIQLLEVIDNYPYENTFLRFRNHAIFSILLFAGLRKQELLNLNYVDVDTDNLTIFIRQGKGYKDRVVPMTETLAYSLRRYIKERRKMRKTNSRFFSSLRGNVPFTENGLKKLVEQLRKSSKIFFTIHMLRHTFATLMIEGGCDIYSLSKMMGHSDIKTTTIYLSASAEHLRSQITKHPLNI